MLFEYRQRHQSSELRVDQIVPLVLPKQAERRCRRNAVTMGVKSEVFITETTENSEQTSDNQTEASIVCAPEASRGGGRESMELAEGDPSRGDT